MLFLLLKILLVMVSSLTVLICGYVAIDSYKQRKDGYINLFYFVVFVIQILMIIYTNVVVIFSR